MKENSIIVAVGFGLAALIGFSMMKKPKQPLVFLPNSIVDAVQGQSFTLRLPRASKYEMIGGDPLEIVAQNDVGLHSDVVIAVGSSASEYVVTPRITAIDNPSKSFEITVDARKIH